MFYFLLEQRGHDTFLYSRRTANETALHFNESKQQISVRHDCILASDSQTRISADHRCLYRSPERKLR